MKGEGRREGEEMRKYKRENHKIIQERKKKVEQIKGRKREDRTSRKKQR